MSIAQVAPASINFDVSAFVFLKSAEYRIGLLPPDPWNRPETDPSTFDTVALGGPDGNRFRFEYEIAEVVLNGAPKILVAMAAKGSEPQDPLDVYVNGEPVGQLTFLESIGRRFAFAIGHFPYPSTISVERPIVIQVGRGKSLILIEDSLSALVLRKRLWIDSLLRSVSMKVSPKRQLLARYLREVMDDVTEELCLNYDANRVRQRQIRVREDPGFWDNMLGLLIAEYRLLADGKTTDLEHHLYVWKAADGSLQPLFIQPAFDRWRPRVNVHFHYLDGAIRRYNIWRWLVDVHNNEIPLSESDELTISTFGRGNSFSLFDEQEMDAVTKWIDRMYRSGRPQIVLSGHSAGASDALACAMRLPELPDALDLSAGAYFEESAWTKQALATYGRKEMGAREWSLLDQLYNPVRTLRRLRGVKVRLVCGELDGSDVEAATRALALMREYGIAAEQMIVPGADHNFMPRELSLDESLCLHRLSLPNIEGGEIRSETNQSIQANATVRFAEPFSATLRGDQPGVLRIATHNIQ
jgi:pimeloyl-ACP methyl ester carboxylesterase